MFTLSVYYTDYDKAESATGSIELSVEFKDSCSPLEIKVDPAVSLDD